MQGDSGFFYGGTTEVMKILIARDALGKFA